MSLCTASREPSTLVCSSRLSLTITLGTCPMLRWTRGQSSTPLILAHGSTKKSQDNDHQDGHHHCSQEQHPPQLFPLAYRPVLLSHKHLILSCLVALLATETSSHNLHYVERPNPPLATPLLEAPHLLHKAGAFQKWTMVSAPPEAMREPSGDQATLKAPSASIALDGTG